MSELNHHNTPVEYVKCDLGYHVKIYGKTIGLLWRENTDYNGDWLFSPMVVKDCYHGLSKDMAVLNYLAHQYGGGLDA